METKKNVVYINLHQGTCMNMDAIAQSNDWNLLHLKPNHGYEMSEALADEVFNSYYLPAVRDHEADVIVIGDITITCGYPIMKHLDKLPDRVQKVVLQITNYFYYGNEHKTEIIETFRSAVINSKKVCIVYVDPFILKTLHEYDIYSPRCKYIPHAGRVIPDLRNSSIACPTLKAANGSSYANLAFYYDSVPKEPVHDVAWIIALGNLYNMYVQKTGGGLVDLYPHQAYGGPVGLSKYYGVVYVPYHYSTMALQEHLSQGLKVFVPSVNLYKKCLSGTLDRDVLLMDAYHGPLSSLLVQFHSVHHLRQLIKELSERPVDVKEAEKQKQIAYMRSYDERIYQQWQSLISEEPYVETEPEPEILPPVNANLPGLKNKVYTLEMFRPYIEAANNPSRYPSFAAVLEYLESKPASEPLTIVEFGTSRSYVSGRLEQNQQYWDPNEPSSWDWGAGVFTVVMALVLKSQNRQFQIYTVDPDPCAIRTCRHMLKTLGVRRSVHYYTTTSTNFLDSFMSKADIFYMDHAESGTPGVQDLHLTDAKIIAEYGMLKPGGMMLFDDHVVQPPKGGLAIPYLLEKCNFKLLIDGYQVLLQHVPLH